MTRRLLSVLAACAAFISASSPWAWAQLFGAPRDAPVVLAILAVLTVGLAAATFAVVRGGGERAAKAVALFAAACFVFGLARPWLPDRLLAPPFGWVWVGAFAIAIIAVAGRIAGDTLERLTAAVVLGAAANVLSPVVRLAMEPAQSVPILALPWLNAQARLPTVVVLFDEFSPELTDDVLAYMDSQAPGNRRAIVPAAGPNTVNAVPAMLTGGDFSEVVPCGIATLCGRSAAIDFRKLTTAADVDVIAAALPYCSIPTLRSCVSLDTGARWFTLAYQFLCVDIGRPFGCPQVREYFRGRDSSGRKLRLATPAWRLQLEAGLDAAPFWQRGGTIYLHLPLPHLPAALESGDLRTDYLSNIREVTEVVRALVGRSQQRFGSRYNLLLLSDHPLRVARFCSLPFYAGPKCGDGLPPPAGKVPVIVSSPSPGVAWPPRDALGILK